MITSPGNVGYARAANLGIAATRAPVVAVLNPDLTMEPGTAKAMLARFDERARRWARAVRGSATSTAPTTRRRGVRRRCRSRSRTACSGCGGRRIRSRRGTASSTPIPSRPALGRLGLGRGGLAAAQRARRGRRLGRALLHVHGGPRPLLAAAAGRFRASRTSPGGAVTHVQGASTSRTPVPDARRAPPLGVAVRPAPPRPGRGAVLLPFAAVYLAARCVLAMAEHAWHASRPGPARG